VVIREVGLLFRGFSLISAKFHQTGKEVDEDLRSGLITAILNFAQNAFLKSDIEYLEGEKFIIAFHEGRIRTEDAKEREPFIAYAILDKEKKIEKKVQKIIYPLLKKTLQEFKKEHEGKFMSEVSQFRGFKQNLQKIFNSDSKTIEQKFEDLFSD
jgi:hypothetical protein